MAATEQLIANTKRQYYGPTTELPIIYLHFLKYNALGMGGTSKGVSLPPCPQMGLLVLLVMPPLVTTVVCHFTGGPQAMWLP